MYLDKEVIENLILKHLKNNNNYSVLFNNRDNTSVLDHLSSNIKKIIGNDNIKSSTNPQLKVVLGQALNSDNNLNYRLVKVLLDK